mgnify:FL=1
MSTAVMEPSAKAEAGKAKREVSPFTVLFLIIGLVCLLYPVVATWSNNQNQSETSRIFAGQVEDQDRVAERLDSIERAKRWNVEHANAPILDPWLTRVREDNPLYLDYLKQLNTEPIMGRVVIPSINSDLPLRHGTTEAVLKNGVGHLFGSSLPTGGPGTHAVITGHTGLADSTLWDNLRSVKVGDAVYVQNAAEKLKYEVHNIEVVLPDQTDALRVVEGEDLLTLITCTPYGVNSHRLLVHAHRVPLDPEDEQALAKVYTPWQWWMTAALAIALLALASVIAWRLRAGREANRAQEPQGIPMENMNDQE